MGQRLRNLAVAAVAAAAVATVGGTALATEDVVRFEDAAGSISSMVVADLAGDSAAAYRWTPASLCRDVSAGSVGHYLPGNPPPETPFSMMATSTVLDACQWSTRQDFDPGVVSVSLRRRTIDDLRLEEHGATRDRLPEWLVEEHLGEGVSVFLVHRTGAAKDAPSDFALILYEGAGLGIDVQGEAGGGGESGLHEMALAIARNLPADGLNPDVGPAYRDWLVENDAASPDVLVDGQMGDESGGLGPVSGRP